MKKLNIENKKVNDIIINLENNFIKISGVNYFYPIKIKNVIIEGSFRSLCSNFQTLTIENTKFFNNPEIEQKKDDSFNLFRSNFIGIFTVRNCEFKGKVNISALHCLKDVVIENCIFEEFVDFGDCWFRNNTTIRNNTFKKGTNLMGNSDKAYKVTFDKKPTIENNIGNLEMNILT
ncbi:hypothetical protein [Polaribacter glomeratus]|uniref:Right handed beta helix domain-containing protein n=1 Tax=Polaribacter glomeratus TaxID=102 RepID=A0A2S7WGM3_9FLAO|nr:hypothetical protein [Polaribacter glomeratus]PQJ76757.1 hypothetical protein BTO16_12825 [Polaribacter glomeratus]TXD67401.1 hypothetical protein ESX12_02090 [Polaribacter glomeratus]